MKNIKLSTEYDLILRGAIYAGCEYLGENPSIETMIIGVSGGIDSALTAALARKVCDTHKERDVKLIGFCLEIDGNKPEEMVRASTIGKAFCDEFTFVNSSVTFIDSLLNIDVRLFEEYVSKIPPGCTIDEKIRAGNIKARTRMTYLYNQAKLKNGIVLSSGNLTEWHLGFWTLHGDVGDYSFLHELWKTEVYGLASMIGGPLIECVEATPTDGLGITNSDIDQLLPDWKLGDSGTHIDAYKVIDEILIDHLSGFRTYPKDHPVISRNLNTEFKRKGPTSPKRDLLLWKHNLAWLPKEQ